METDIFTSKTKQLFFSLKSVRIIHHVPTRNEAGNVENLLRCLRERFGERSIEVILVDDSTDNTPQVVENAVEKFPSLHVKLIHRLPHQRTGGLGGAVIAGLKIVQLEFACVMDGDLQHPPELVPVLLKTAIDQQVDMVVATRRSKENDVAGLSIFRDFDNFSWPRLTARIFFPKQLRGVSDPLTGFFLLKVSAIDIETLRPNGSKFCLIFW